MRGSSPVALRCGRRSSREVGEVRRGRRDFARRAAGAALRRRRPTRRGGGSAAGQARPRRAARRGRRSDETAVATIIGAALGGGRRRAARGGRRRRRAAAAPSRARRRATPRSPSPPAARRRCARLASTAAAAARRRARAASRAAMCAVAAEWRVQMLDVRAARCRTRDGDEHGGAAAVTAVLAVPRDPILQRIQGKPVGRVASSPCAPRPPPRARGLPDGVPQPAELLTPLYQLIGLTARGFVTAAPPRPPRCGPDGAALSARVARALRVPAARVKKLVGRMQMLNSPKSPRERSTGALHAVAGGAVGDPGADDRLR